MILEGGLLFTLNSLLVLLFVLLLLDDLQEGITLGFSLLSEHDLLLHELLFASLFKFGS